MKHDNYDLQRQLKTKNYNYSAENTTRESLLSAGSGALLSAGSGAIVLGAPDVNANNSKLSSNTANNSNNTVNSSSINAAGTANNTTTTSTSTVLSAQIAVASRASYIRKNLPSLKSIPAGARKITLR